MQAPPQQHQSPLCTHGSDLGCSQGCPGGARPPCCHRTTALCPANTLSHMRYLVHTQTPQLVRHALERECIAQSSALAVTFGGAPRIATCRCTSQLCRRVWRLQSGLQSKRRLCSKDGRTWYLDDFFYGTGCGRGSAGHLVVEDEQPPLEVGDVLLVCMPRAPRQQCMRHSEALWLMLGAVAVWPLMSRALNSPVKWHTGDRQARAGGVSPMKQWSAVRRYFFPRGALTIVPAHAHTAL